MKILIWDLTENVFCNFYVKFFNRKMYVIVLVKKSQFKEKQTSFIMLIGRSIVIVLLLAGKTVKIVFDVICFFI